MKSDSITRSLGLLEVLIGSVVGWLGKIFDTLLRFANRRIGMGLVRKAGRKLANLIDYWWFSFLWHFLDD